jgi:GT2 family glycosyltransferase
MLFRRDVLDTIGYLDERFFLYSEETDWQIRLLNRGYRLLAVRAGHSTHVGASSIQQVNATQGYALVRQAAWSHIELARKHRGELAALQARAVTGALFSIRAAALLAMSLRPNHSTLRLRALACAQTAGSALLCPERLRYTPEPFAS